MTNAIKITAVAAQTLENNNWVIATNEYLVGIYKTRTEAREAKATGLLGSVKNKSELEFEIVDLKPVVEVVPVAEPTKVSKQKEVGEVALRNTIATEITHESTIERPCKAVWAIAEDMKGQKRGVVLAACVKAGIAYYTARTQYQAWLQIQKEMAKATRVTL